MDEDIFESFNAPAQKAGANVVASFESSSELLDSSRKKRRIDLNDDNEAPLKAVSSPHGDQSFTSYLLCLQSKETPASELATAVAESDVPGKLFSVRTVVYFMANTSC